MNLVDSSGWLEYFAGGKNAKVFSPVVENIEDLIVSTINLYEIYKKVLMERDESNALEAIGIMHQATVIDVNSSIAIQAAKISSELKLPMADSLIYATAQQMEAVIWTQDADFKNLENVRYFKK